MITRAECFDAPLQHTLLAQNLPAYSCGKCEGVLLSLVAYRHWRDVYGASSQFRGEFDNSVSIEDSSHAKKCPKCCGLMTKYRVSAGVDNRLDYCAHCEEIWLDKGEWTLIERLAVSGHLTKIVTQPWQQRIRAEFSETVATERLKHLLGVDYEKFIRFREWLNQHDAREEIVVQLLQKNRA